MAFSTRGSDTSSGRPEGRDPALPGPAGLLAPRGKAAWRRLGRNPLAMTGAALAGLMVIAGLLAPWLAPYGYDHDDFRPSALEGPSRAHPLGVDTLGRDTLSRVIFGARVSLQVAVSAVAVSVAIGVVAGAAAGYLGGWTDELLMRLADTFSAFPGILLAVAITAAVEKRSLLVVFIALGLVGWPGLARIVRGQVLALREEEFVLAARALGAGRPRIVFRHILPHCLAPVIVAATALMAGNILGEAGLGFLGIGVAPPHPSWGNLLADARPRLTAQPWLCIGPAAAVAMAVLGFNLLGDGLRDAIDPRQSG